MNSTTTAAISSAVQRLGRRQISAHVALTSPLTGERLVEQRSRYGYFVHAYSWEELMPIFELRAGLEAMAIRLCVENRHQPPSLEVAGGAVAYPQHLPAAAC